MNSVIPKVKYAFVRAGIAADDNPAQNTPTKQNGGGSWEDFLTPSLSITRLCFPGQCGLQQPDMLRADNLSTERLVPNCFSKNSWAEANRMGLDRR